MAAREGSSAVDEVCTTFGVTEEQAIDIHVLEESLGITVEQAYQVYKENDFDVAAAAAALEDQNSDYSAASSDDGAADEDKEETGEHDGNEDEEKEEGAETAKEQANSDGDVPTLTEAETAALQKLQAFFRNTIAGKHGSGSAAALQGAVNVVAEQLRRFNQLLLQGLEVQLFPMPPDDVVTPEPVNKIMWLHSDGALYVTDQNQMQDVRDAHVESKKFASMRIMLHTITAVTTGAEANAFKRSTRYASDVHGSEDHCMSVVGSLADTQFHMKLVSARACELLSNKLCAIQTMLDGAGDSYEDRAKAAAHFAMHGHVPHWQQQKQPEPESGAEQASKSSKPKKRWLGRFGPKSNKPQEDQESEADKQASPTDGAKATKEQASENSPKKRWFGRFGSKSKPEEEQQPDDDKDEPSEDEPEAEEEQAQDPLRSNLRRLRAIFNTIDDNGDGQLDREEVVNAMKAVDTELAAMFPVKPGPTPKPPSERFNEMFEEIDADGDGVVNWDEFLAFFMQEGVVSGVGASEPYDVIITEEKAGLLIVTGRTGPGIHTVDRVVPGSQAETGGVLPGCELLMVGDVNVRGNHADHETVLRHLANTPRPTRLRVQRVLGGPAITASLEQNKRIEIAAIIKAHQAELADAKLEKQKQWRSMKQEKRDDLAALNEKHATKLSETISGLKTQHAADLDQERNGKEAALAKVEELQQALAKMSAAVDGLNDAHSKSIADAQKRVAKAEREKAAELQKLKETLERSYGSELVRAVKAAKDELEAEHATTVTKLRHDHSKVQSKMQASHNEALASAKTTHASKSSMDIAKLKEALADAQKKTSKDEATIKALEASLATTTQALQDLHAATDVADGRHRQALASSDEAIQGALAEASAEHEAEKKRAVEEMRAELENEHTQALEALRLLHTAEVEQKISAAIKQKSVDLENAHAVDKRAQMTKYRTALVDEHTQALADLADEKDAAHKAALTAAEEKYTEALAKAAATAKAMTTATATLVEQHNKRTDALQEEHATAMADEQREKKKLLKEASSLKQSLETTTAALEKLTAASVGTQSVTTELERKHGSKLETMEAEFEIMKAELMAQHENDRSRALQEQRIELSKDHEIHCSELLADHAAVLASEKETCSRAVARAKKAEARAEKLDAALAQSTEALELLAASANKSHANNAALGSQQAAQTAEFEVSRDEHAKALAAAEANAAKAKAQVEALQKSLDNTTAAMQALIETTARNTQQATDETAAAVEEVRAQLANNHAQALQALQAENDKLSTAIKKQSEKLAKSHEADKRAAMAKCRDELDKQHTEALAELAATKDSAHKAALAAAKDEHAKELAKISETASSMTNATAEMVKAHNERINTLQDEHTAALATAQKNKTKLQKKIEILEQSLKTTTAALEQITAGHEDSTA